MSGVWLTVAVVGVGTAAIKALGPVALGGRPLPERLTSVVSLLAPALLSALVAVQALGAERSIVLDERLLGLAAAGVALWLKAPLLVVVIVAAAVTAISRLVV
jgi:branched-subunit amino acid transport protein